MNAKRKGSVALRVVSIILLCVLVIILVCNLAVIVKGSINPDRPPSILGYTTMIVLTDSMSGDAPDHIEAGDMIVTKPCQAAALEAGDIITFMETNGRTTVTHRIITVNEDGSYETKGDFNNAADKEFVTADRIIGEFWFRIPKLGFVANYAQTPVGMALFIGVPLLLFLFFDSLIRAKDNKKSKKKSASVEAENERLAKELEELKARMSESAEEAEEKAEEKAEETVE